MRLPGVVQNVKDLRTLWENTYKYDVFVLNEDTLYCTKNDIFDFIDKHQYRLEDKKYQSVIVHVISHATNHSFLTSNTSKLEQLPFEYIHYELTCAECDSHRAAPLIKLVFHHGCRITINDNNHRFGSRSIVSAIHSDPTNNIECNCSCCDGFTMQSRGILSCMSRDEEKCFGRKISAYNNSAIIYANLPDRTISDKAYLTATMSKYFIQNVKTLKKNCFKEILGNISRDVMLKTGYGEICEMEYSFSFKNITFEPYKNKINVSKKGTLVVDNALVLIIAIDQFDFELKYPIPGIQEEVSLLKHLWKETYKYEVFVCNEETLCCTKNDIINFVDLHKEKLWNSDFKCIMVHILSLGNYQMYHGAYFKTSDSKKMPLQFFEHEILDEDFGKEDLIKLIFYNTPRGNSHFYNEEDTDCQNDKSIPDANRITVYGTSKGMEMSDEGEFTQAICNAFGSNAKKIMKHDFDTLLYDIKNDLESLTKGEQTCSILHCLAYNEIRFNKASKKEHHDQKHVDYNHYICMETNIS